MTLGAIAIDILTDGTEIDQAPGHQAINSEKPANMEGTSQAPTRKQSSPSGLSAALSTAIKIKSCPLQATHSSKWTGFPLWKRVASS
jgi:hypothetical protein